MKIIATKSDLLSAVNIVLKAVPAKTTMSILECILIDCSEGKITFVANDTELGITTEIPGDVLQRGSICLEAKLFSEIIRKLPDSEVSIETDDNNRAMIRCEKAKFLLAGKDAGDFVLLPEIKRVDPIVISEFTLKDTIRQTIFSVSDNESNKIMTGLLFEVTEDQLKVVSLDGQRISMRKVALKESYEPVKVIVPGKTLSDVNKILNGDMDSDVRIYVTDSHMIFEFARTVVVTRLIEGEYFAIDRMISSDFSTKVSVNKKELQNCIDRASLFVKENERKPIIISITDGQMEMKIQSAIGSMNEELDVVKEGRDLMIGFNPKFVMDALRVIDEEVVSIYMANPKAPFTIRNEEQTYLYLILPISFNV